MYVSYLNIKADWSDFLAFTVSNYFSIKEIISESNGLSLIDTNRIGLHLKDRNI